MAYYIQKSILKTRDQFGKPDNFVNLNALIEEVADAGNPDLSALQDDIDDLQTDLGTVQTDLGTVQNEAETKIISLQITPFLSPVQPLDAAVFVVPASMNGYVLHSFNVRHATASSGASNSTSVQVYRGANDLLSAGFVNINAQAITPTGTIATDNTVVLATNDAVTVDIGSIPTGGTAPKGLFATLVFKPAP
jgi:hypothetical protein